jgi:hypothetical protein
LPGEESVGVCVQDRSRPGPPPPILISSRREGGISELARNGIKDPLGPVNTNRHECRKADGNKGTQSRFFQLMETDGKNCGKAKILAIERHRQVSMLRLCRWGAVPTARHMHTLAFVSVRKDY